MRKLRSEEEIIASWKGDINKPVVSICCAAFNHESYIGDALEGFLIQETDFPFEVLIHDDASTDRTAEIIRKYEAKYPRLIKPIYQTENQYSQGVKISATFNFPRARGKYIALCEGDDYWLSCDKLQLQKEFMEANENYSFCFHKAKERDDTSVFNAYSAYRQTSKNTFYAKDIILNHFIPTLSIFFKKKCFEKYLLNFKGDFVSGDIFMEVLLSVEGKGYCFHKEMGVYRHHDGGVTKGVKDKRKSINSNKNLYDKLRILVPKKHHKYINIADVMKSDLPLVKINFYDKKYLSCINGLIKAFLKSPLWPYYFFKNFN